MDKLILALVYLGILYKFPLLTLLVSLGLSLMYHLKKRLICYSISKEKPIRPKAGDILLFFSNNIVNPSHHVLWDGILTIPTVFPVRHYGIVLDDTYYLEARHPSVFNWDNFTRKITNGARLGKLKHIQNDWNQGMIAVVETDLNVTRENFQSIQDTMTGKKYWEVTGCLGIVNRTISILNPNHRTCLRPEDFINAYGKRYGPIATDSIAFTS
jgi:hypothetical protein